MNMQSQALISPQEMESWFLGQLEAETIPFEPLIHRLQSLYEQGARDLADSLGEFLQDALVDRGESSRAFEVLELRAIHRAHDVEFCRQLSKVGLKMLGNTPENRSFFKNVGFDAKVPVAECLRRLQLLRTLAAGVKCYDRTWGYGLVRDIDHFYERVQIDFETKSEHEMSFAYAAETLELIGDDHILCMKHDRPEALEALVKENPAEVVRIALRNYGPMNVQILQERLVPGIVSDGDWKRFWDGARKGLKNDPLVEIPVKRTDAIRLLHKEKAYDVDWFRDLAANNNMENILLKVETLVEEAGGEEWTAEEVAVLSDRLGFVVKGAGNRRPDLSIRAVLAADAFGVDSSVLQVGTYAGDLYSQELFVPSMEALGAKDAKRFLSLLARLDSARAMQLWIGLLPVLDASALGEVVELLVQSGFEQECIRAMKGQIDERAAGVDALLWMWRNQPLFRQWRLGAIKDLLDLTFKGIEADASGSPLRAQNQIKDYFKQPEWIRSVMEQLSEKEQADFFLELKSCSAWPEMELRSILARYIKAYPKLERLMREGGSDSGPVVTSSGPQTSARSYTERQLQLERIKNVEIPKNSKEIALARSYGDLSENHEYKAAKEMQSILMRRQGELEQMLSATRPTDFDGAGLDEVAMGNGVCLAYPDGREETYFILGVWDRDEHLHVISCETRMALSLMGRRAGDEVEVPTEHGTAMCRVKEILPLSDEIRTWIRVEPQTSQALDVDAG